MKTILLQVLMALMLVTICSPVNSQQKINVREQMELAAQQYERLLETHPDITKTPQSLFPDGTYRDMPTSWWCSGFFGGSLWYLYEYTKDERWKAAADKWTMAVEKEKYNKSTHDLGFMLYCPFGNGYRLTNNPLYREVLVTGAQSLASRFDPKVGVIKSWDSFKGHQYPVIIDNMMNLEFLFWVAKETRNQDLYDICIKHADKTLAHHFRPDHSSFHVICYDPAGNVEAKLTHQGFADESAWARGQAWGLYGYTVMYRETRQQVYLNQAIKIANFMLQHRNLPTDKVPYWDFDDTGIPTVERDASAGAITAAALLELADYVKKEKKTYLAAAETILVSLSSPAYRAKLGENGHFLLKHSVGNKPAKSEIDVPIVYADYYYLEALIRYHKKKGGK